MNKYQKPKQPFTERVQPRRQLPSIGEFPEDFVADPLAAIMNRVAKQTFAPKPKPTTPNWPKTVVAPFVLWDADALKTLFHAESIHDSLGDAVKAPRAMLDYLSEPQRATIIIPRRVLNEIASCVTEFSENFHVRKQGYLDLSRDAEDKLEFNPAPTMAATLSDESHQFVQWLLQRREHGQLRLYDSLESMANSGELLRAKGGVVIVDTDHERPIDDRRFRHFTPQETGQHRGDKALAALAEAICAYAKKYPETKKNTSLLVVSNDKGCKEAIDRATRSSVISEALRPLQTNILTLARAFCQPKRGWINMGEIPLFQSLIIDGYKADNYRTAHLQPDGDKQAKLDIGNVSDWLRRVEEHRAEQVAKTERAKLNRWR